MFPTWFWVLLWVVLAIAAVGTLGWLALSVWRKVKALLAELGQVMDQAGDAVDLLARIDVPEGVERWSEEPFERDDADSGFTAARRVNADQPT